MKDVRIDDQLVRDNERMLTDGFYAEVTLTYDGVIAQEKAGRPFKVEGLRPIQMSKADVLDAYMKARLSFSTSEWIDFLLRSIGLEGSAFNDRAKRVVLLRMIPFVERNYNLVELGPRGTGKSHLFHRAFERHDRSPLAGHRPFECEDRPTFCPAPLQQPKRTACARKSFPV